MVVKTKVLKYKNLKELSIDSSLECINKFNSHFTNHMSGYYKDILLKGTLVLACFATILLLVL